MKTGAANRHSAISDCQPSHRPKVERPIDCRPVHPELAATSLIVLVGSSCSLRAWAILFGLSFGLLLLAPA
jgi:hypothetical protein